MQTVKFQDLTIAPNRQRKVFEEKKMIDLASSIQDKGLLHPPVVRNDGKTLVAGERRCKAIAYLAKMQIPIICNGQKIPLGEIPVTLIGELSDLQVREAELEENLCRVDLNWREEAIAIAELDALRKGQDPTWTALDTAREIDDEPVPSGPTYNKVRDATILKKYMDDPDVQKAGSAKEAVKVIRKKIRDMTNAALAEVHAVSETPHTILNGNFQEIITTLPDEKFSVILTDPPYGIEADNFGSMASESHEYNDGLDHALSLVEILAAEGYRVCLPEAHAYVFCDIRHFDKFAMLFSLAGWNVWPTPIIWNKGNGMLPRPEHGPRRTYETILYALKGEKKINSVYGDVISISGIQKPEFAAQKPSALYAELLRHSVSPGDHVLDCFAGSGPILPAANDCHVIATAIELNPNKFNFMLQRTAETTKYGLEDLLKG